MGCVYLRGPIDTHKSKRFLFILAVNVSQSNTLSTFESDICCLHTQSYFDNKEVQQHICISPQPLGFDMK